MEPSGNPIIRHKFTTDPSVIVHDDTVFLYTGHDEAAIGASKYVMNEWLCFSSHDLTTWIEHPVPLRSSDFTWSRGGAYAPKVIERDGRFFFYAPVTHATISGRAIGVAVSDDARGPFRDAIGEALITGSMVDGDSEFVNIDPAVLIDDDGQAHIYWGKGVCYHARLKPNMIELDGAIETISLPGFEEGAHVHRRTGWYYFSYGFGSPERVAYAMSRSATGPWTFKGILNELAGNCQTNRPAVIEWRGRSYFFYHNGGLPTGGSYRRSVCIDDLRYNDDGTMQRVVMTSEGVGGRHTTAAGEVRRALMGQVRVK
jgi:beta-xylosidase